MISQEEAEKYKEALEKLLDANTNRLSYRGIADIARDALNPPPETEEVPVVRYKIVYDSGELSGCRDFGTIEELLAFCPSASENNIAKLTGKVTRLKPRRVLRREEIGEITGPATQLSAFLKAEPPVGSKIFVEWYE